MAEGGGLIADEWFRELMVADLKREIRVEVIAQAFEEADRV